MKLIVSDCAPWDGEYECDIFAFTNRQLHKVKVISEGVRPGELVEALNENDTGAFVAVAAVVLEQHGVTVDPNDFWDAKVGSLSLDLGVSTDPPTMPANDGEPSVSTNGSGDDSRPGGEPVGNSLSRTGGRSSATPTSGRDSDLATSAT